MVDIIDSYSEANRNTYVAVSAVHPSASAALSSAGQCITALLGRVLAYAQFFLLKNGNPTGNLAVYVYNITGTYGTNAKPTGPALAVSDVVNASSISSIAYQLVTFNFSGVNKIEVVEGNKYALALQAVSAVFDGSNNVLVGVDSSSPSHSGNYFYYSSSAWGSHNFFDVCFYLYGSVKAVGGVYGLGKTNMVMTL